jgi:ATP diphosphatase
MARLRDPDTGCPWDLQQDYSSIAPHTLEECYELVDTIERGDFAHLQEELGDVLFQVVFYSQLAREDSEFDFAQVVELLVDKLVRRHPHVFPDGQLRGEVSSARLDTGSIAQKWESIKQQERTQKSRHGLLADIPAALPAMTRAKKLQKRASGAGFDWPDIGGVVDKLREETDELQREITLGDSAAIEEELGDLLFSVVNLARHLHLDPETVLRKANRKFAGRFGAMERHAGQEGLALEQISQEKWQQLWLLAKQTG